MSTSLLVPSMYQLNVFSQQMQRLKSTDMGSIVYGLITLHCLMFSFYRNRENFSQR